MRVVTARGPSRVVRTVLAALLLAALSFSTPISGTACDPPLTPFNLSIVGHSGGIFTSVETTGASILAVQGSTLVSLEASGGVLTRTGAAPGPVAGDLFVDGDRAYVVGVDRFGIFDVTDPSAPELLGVAEMPSVEYEITGFFAAGDYAYAGYEKYGSFATKVFCVEDPVSPTIVAYSGLVITDARPDVRGTTAYLLADDGTIDVVDLSSATSPAVVDTVETVAADVAASDGCLYASLAAGGVGVWDLADPGAPILAGSAVGLVGDSISAAGDDVWRVVDGAVELWDASVKATPVLADTDVLDGVLQVAAVADGTGACVLSEADDTSLSYYETVSVPGQDTLLGIVEGNAGDEAVALQGDTAFIASEAGIRSHDLSDPGLALLDEVDVGTDAIDVAVAGTLGAVATGAGLTTLDAGDPSSLAVADSVAVPGGLIRVAIDGDTVYGISAEALYSFDASDPSDVALLDTYAFADTSTDLDARDGRVWVTLDLGNGSGNLLEFDASDPSMLTALGEHGLPGGMPAVTVTTETAYVGLTDEGWGGSGVKIFDVSDPGCLSYLKYHSLGQYLATDVCAVDGAMLSAGEGGVMLTGIEDPTLPYAVGYLPVAGARVAREGDLLAVARPGGGTTFLRYAPLSFRSFGGDRFETAIAMSRTFDSSEYVVLATGRAYPDALAGVPLAYALDAPVLLCEPTVIPAAVAEEIERLGADKAIVLGGTAALGESIVTQLRGMGFAGGDITRISGASRYDTARAIAMELEDVLGAGSIDTAFVATGKNFPDALAAAGAAASAGCPVLLVRPDTSNTAARAALSELGITNTIVVGGEVAVPPSVVAGLPSPERLSGATRFDTAARIAEWSLERPEVGFDAEELFVVTGLNFPDALSCGVVAARNGAPTLLVGEDPPAPTLDFVRDHATEIGAVQIVGGDAAVCAAVEQWIVAYVR